MRLKLIKISGFKSFVETTRLVLASERVGIVGPNGCGKSNTLDAVRWVMGESSAKELRGGDMNDVLFNGTDKRKAVSQCSVELLFDNEAGQAGGAYASFAEISVKRVHHREEGTSYYLNQRRCRRRDIIDLFNGTGLGPRSYALIGQGNISRIIEAKPEDMRVYLEEVAGIGPYRSRRKETLLRLERTRENLNQLAVLQEALGEQAEHLALQAEKARDYHQAAQRQQLLEKSVYYFQWQHLHQQQAQAQTDLRQAEQDFARSKAQWDQVQKDWLLARQQLPAMQTELEQHEAEYHRLDKLVEKLKQQQDFSSQQSQQWQDQQRLNQEQQQMRQTQLAALNQQQAELDIELEAIADQQADIETQLETYDQDWDSLQAQKTTQEQALQKAQWQAQQLEQRFKQLQQELQSLEQTAAHLAEQKTMLAQHLDEEQTDELGQKTVAIEAELVPLQAEIEANQHQLMETQKQVADQRTRLAQFKTDQTQLQHQLAAAQAEHKALFAVQQSLVDSMPNEDQTLDEQLSAQTLVSQLKVSPAWQAAVEAWLGAKLQGLLLNQAWSFDENSVLPKASLLGWNPGEIEVKPNSLAAQIQQPGLVKYLAQSVFLLDAEQAITPQIEALKNQDKQAWLIDQQGVLYSAYAIIQPTQNSLSGVLERQERIDQLSKEVNALENNLEEVLPQIEQAEVQLQSHLERQEKQQNKIAQQQREHQRLSDQLAHLVDNQTQVEARRQKQQTTQNALQHRQTKLAQDTAEKQMDIEALNEQLELADEAEEHAQQALESTLNKLQPVAREREKLEIQNQRLDQQIHHNQQALQQIKFQQQQLAQQLKQDQLQAEMIARHLTQSVKVDAEDLAQKEQALSASQRVLEQLQQDYRQQQALAETCQLKAETAQQQHHQAEQTLVTQQLQLQNAQQQIQTLQKTLESQGLSAYELSQLRFEEEPIEKLEAELKQVKLHLARLGAVNMTAIEEHQQVKDKLDSLVEQIADLEASIDTLEQAINTIDQDSRQRLMDTFDQVNRSFKTLFPRLFQGGEASLSWLDPDQDPLEGGVVVMARPPGKRNTRIQLLSGGEKTLTALALIFAIFELKPAPFCILDEVDAPLDDSNVIRFCGLVRSLSEKVQFIFITHNKTTMAMAKHLVGVTMHEPGVSRLVSVDLEAAVEMIGETGQ